MKAVWVLVAIGGCAPARPEKLERPQPLPHPIRYPDGGATPVRQIEFAPAPAIDISRFTPDFHDELRWPLTPMNHPVMEPKFPIAQEFAEPGVGWMELCSSGVTNRYGGDKELLSYLRGWCKAVEGDTDAACTNLAPLMHSTKPRLETAVRNDLANILAQGHADKAEHFIQVHQLRDVAMLDLLAANFVEVGTTDDALTINRNAIDSDDYATPATKCMRWTRQIVLLGDKVSPLMKQVESFATVPKSPDPTCVSEYTKLKCWAQRDCTTFVQQLGGSPFEVDVIDALGHWTLEKSPTWWWRFASVVDNLIAAHAARLFSNAELAEIGLSAIENARAIERASNQACSDGTRKKMIGIYAATLRPSLDQDQASRLGSIEAECK